MQTLTPRAWLVLRSLPLAQSPSWRAALKHFFLALFFSSIPLPFCLQAAAPNRASSMSYTQEGRLGLPGGARGNAGGAARSPEPRQVPLKLLLLSLEVLDIFHLGTQSHQEGGEGRQHRGNGQADTSLTTLPAGHPTTPKGTGGLSSPSDWSCSSQMKVSSLPRDSEAGSGTSPCTRAALGSPGQEGTAGLCALDLSCRWQIHPD